MQSPRSFYRLLGIVLILAVVMVGSGMPPSAEAQPVPIPPQSPFETIIQPGGMKGERYGLDHQPLSRDHARERFPRGHARDHVSHDHGKDR